MLNRYLKAGLCTEKGQNLCVPVSLMLQGHICLHCHTVKTLFSWRQNRVPILRLLNLRFRRYVNFFFTVLSHMLVCTAFICQCCICTVVSKRLRPDQDKTENIFIHPLSDTYLGSGGSSLFIVAQTSFSPASSSRHFKAMS